MIFHTIFVYVKKDLVYHQVPKNKTPQKYDPLEKQVPTWYAKQAEIMVASVEDEPNLYFGNGWKSPNIHSKLVVWGTKVVEVTLFSF